MNIHDAINLFTQYLKDSGKSPFTIKVFKGHLRRFQRFLYGKYNSQIYLNELAIEDLEEFVMNLSRPMKHGCITAFKCLFNFLCANGYLVDNLGLLIKNPRFKERDVTYLSTEEVDKIFEAVLQLHLKVAIQTIYYLGLRPTECMRIKIMDIDLKKKIANIRNYKGEIERNVPISSKLSSILEEYLISRSQEKKCDLFFVSKTTEKISPDYLNKIFTNAVNTAGIKKGVTLETLRQSFARSLIEKGTDVVTVQKLLGNKSLLSTAFHIGIDISDLRKALSVL